MKKIYLMVFVCSLLIALLGMGPNVRPAACADYEVKIAVNPFSGGMRTPRVREGSYGLLPVVIYSDPNLGDGVGFYAENVDPNVYIWVKDGTYEGDEPIPDRAGSVQYDADRDGNEDLILFYIANTLDFGGAEGESTLVVEGNYGDAEETFMGMADIEITPQFSLDLNFLERLKDRRNGGGGGIMDRIRNR